MHHPTINAQADEDALKAAIILHANNAYAARGLDSDARAVERKPSRAKNILSRRGTGR
ncbi:unnamed protein product [Ectocarpus sp. 6 AP-2014]